MPDNQGSYLILPLILSNFLTNPKATDGRPAGSTSLYKSALGAVTAKLHKDGVSYPPTVGQVSEAAKVALSQSRYPHFRTAWKWLGKALVELQSSEPRNPALGFPAFPEKQSLDTPGTRNGKSKHPVGLAICMWVEIFNCDPEQVCKATYADAANACHFISPSEQHDAVVQAMHAVRHWAYTDPNPDQSLGKWPDYCTDLFLRDPETKLPLTPDTVLDIIKLEGLTLAKLKKGYFNNHIAARPRLADGTPGDAIICCTFQFEVLEARGVEFVPFTLTFGSGTKKYSVVEPFQDLNDARHEIRVHDGMFGYPGEEISQENKNWWKSYYGYRCACHGPPAKQKAPGMLLLEQRGMLDRDRQMMAIVDCLGSGRCREWFGDANDPEPIKATEGPAIDYSQAKPLFPTEPPEAARPFLTTPGIGAIGCCAKCTGRGDADCAEDIRTGRSECPFFDLDPTKVEPDPAV